MRKGTKPMREIHEIQEKIYEEQRQMSDKEKIEAIHREDEEARKRYSLKIKKRVKEVSDITSAVC